MNPKHMMMFKRLLILCLALMLPWASASADAFSLKAAVSAADTSLEGSLLAAQLPDGSTYGSITLDGSAYTAVMTPSLGLLLQGPDGEWQQATAFGTPLNLLTFGTAAADHSGTDDFVGSLLRDLSTLSSMLRTDAQDDAGTDFFIGLWLELMRSGTVTITGDDLTGSIADTAFLWRDVLCPDAVITREEGAVIITLPDEVPDSLSALELGELYADLWHLAVPETGLTIVLPDVPDFTLTVSLTSNSLDIVLASDAVTLNMSFAADLTAMGFRFSGSGSTAAGSFSFSGTAGISGANCTVTTDAAVCDVRLVFGTYASASVQVTLSGQSEAAFSLYASFGPSSLTVNASTPLHTITLSASESMLDVSVWERGASLLTAPLFRLNARLTASSLSVSLTTPDTTSSLTASWQPGSGHINLSRYESSTGRSLTGFLTWTAAPGMLTLSGSLTLPDSPPAAATLSLSSSPYSSLELTVSAGGDIRRYAASVQQPTPDSLQLLLRDSCTGGQNYTRSISASWTTWPDHSRLDLSADDSANGHQPFTASMTVTPGTGSYAAVSLEAYSGSEQLLAGTADAAVDGSRIVVNGSVTLADASPLALQLELDTAPELPVPTWPEAPRQAELFE